MIDEALSLDLSICRVEIAACGAPALMRALRAAWAEAYGGGFVPPRHVLRYRVARGAEGFELTFATGATRVVNDELDLAPRLESSLYAEALHQHARDGLAVLHAAALGAGSTPVLLLGPSGAGKTALARALLDAGLSYWSDEYTVTDGRGVWGFARALHLDPLPADLPSPPWHGDADRSRYRLRTRAGSPLVLPLIAVPRARLAPGPGDLSRAVLVQLERGAADGLASLGAADRLAALSGALQVPAACAAAVALAPRAFRLTWRDPARAASKLLGALARDT